MQLRDYLNIIRKRWWLALVVAGIAALVAFGYSITQPKIYESQITVQGRPAKPDEGLNNAIKSEIRSMPSTLKSTSFAARVDQRARLDLGAGAIVDKLQVQPKPDERNVVITVKDTDAKRAALIANSVADLLHDDYLEQVASTPEDSRIFFEKTSKAPVPDRPSSPRTNLNTGAAAALGLVLGLILIFVVDFFDNGLRTEEEVEQFTGLKVIGNIPAWKTTPGAKLPATSPLKNTLESPLPTSAADGQEPVVPTTQKSKNKQ